MISFGSVGLIVINFHTLGVCGSFILGGLTFFIFCLGRWRGGRKGGFFARFLIPSVGFDIFCLNFVLVKDRGSNLWLPNRGM